MTKIMLIILSIFVAFPCLAATKTRDVYGWCSTLEKITSDSKSASESDWYTAGLCDGFFSGFNDGEYLQYLVSLSGNRTSKTGQQISDDFNNKRAWCEPKEGLSLQQRFMMFNKYVRENPESLHKDAYLTITLAMKPHFPCGT